MKVRRIRTRRVPEVVTHNATCSNNGGPKHLEPEPRGTTLQSIMRRRAMAAAVRAVPRVPRAGAQALPPVAPPPPPQPFSEWLAELRTEAATRGIRPEILEA